MLFSGYFIFLGNSYGNSIQFAKHVLISANQDVSFSTELDTRLVRYIAISVITLVCFIHGYSSKAGLFLNKLLAWYKVILLIVVFAAGMRYSDKHGSQWKDDTIPSNGSSMDGLAAMVLIFYTYQGWENANYVAGEIRALEGRTPFRTLKVGAFLAVGVVWILYVLVAVAYYRVLDYATITGTQSDLGVALYFAPKVRYLLKFRNWPADVFRFSGQLLASRSVWPSRLSVMFLQSLTPLQRSNKLSPYNASSHFGAA